MTFTKKQIIDAAVPKPEINPPREQKLTQLLSEFEAHVTLVKAAYQPKWHEDHQDGFVLKGIKASEIAYQWEQPDEFAFAYENAFDGLCQWRMFYQDWPHVRQTYEAAKVYVIARDERLDAALLWKLRNGGAL